MLSMVGGPVIDDNVRLMLHFDGADASTIIADSASTPHDLSPNDAAALSTIASQFGGSSLKLHGNTSDFITSVGISAGSTDFDIWREDCSIDCWINPLSLPSTGNFMTLAGGSVGGIFGSQWGFLLKNSTSGVTQLVLDTEQTLASHGTFHADVSISTGTFTHVAVEQYNTSVNFYVNGTLQATVIDTSWDSQAAGAYQFTSGRNFDGYIDEMRLTKHVSQYQGISFTPSTVAY